MRRIASFKEDVEDDLIKDAIDEVDKLKLFVGNKKDIRTQIERITDMKKLANIAKCLDKL